MMVRDDSLYQLMLREADDAPLASATDDLDRGRRRLSRRRIGVAAAAACGVLAASVTAYGVSGTTGTSGAPADHDDRSDRPTEFLADQNWSPAKRALERMRAVVFDHTAYAQHATVPRSAAWDEAGLEGFGSHDGGFGYNDGGTAERSSLANAQWERPWKEGSSTGLLRVEAYSRADAKSWGSDWMTRCYNGLWKHHFPTCEQRVTSDGETVLVGLDRRPAGLWMRVSWSHADGTLVSTEFFAPGWPNTQELSLTIDDLMDVTTDPRLAVFDQR
ncbi:MAG TPA: hypothetical protein VEX15_04895 [Nocardioidaceae bacterium]|nr:hypothetical protein [Nocardioidaceae bacterium]